MVKIDFQKEIEDFQARGNHLVPDRVFIQIEDAKQILFDGIQYFASIDNKKPIWLPCYDKLAEWLTNNNGKGLLLNGQCGCGKTLIGYKILPLLIKHYCRKIVSTYEATAINDNPDEVLRKHLICIDDVGTEDVSVKFGNRRQVFSEIVDSVERSGKLLIVTTNLTHEEIRQRYGERTLDRLREVTTPILFTGNSMRGAK